MYDESISRIENDLGIDVEIATDEEKVLWWRSALATG